jgi:hypothetical protein
MMENKSQTTQAVTKSSTVKALRTALEIMTKWGCPPEKQRFILGMKKSTFYENNKNPAKANLSVDQIERISYLLNIHSSLREVFDNPVNVYGFMAMKNDNPFFNGKSPLEIISTGNFGYLYETFKRINTLQSAGW